MIRKFSSLFILIAILAAAAPAPHKTAQAQGTDGSAWLDEGIDPAQWYQNHEIEHAWTPDYLDLATGDPTLQTEHGVYAWPYDLDSIGWNIQSYQDYGGTPYFHHGLDMMKVSGTDVYNRSGGQVINVENYVPGWNLYWEVAILDPDGYIWQYHHIDRETIPQYILDKWAEWQTHPITGGVIGPDTYIGDIVYWPTPPGRLFHHIHLNILASGGVYVNGFEFHVPLPDTAGPQIQGIGLLQNGQIYAGNSIEGDYGLYVHARDLVLDYAYYLPPYEITFSIDGGPQHATWRFDTLPGGASDTAYLDDFYVVPPTCGNYDCRDYYINLGFIPGSQFEFPSTHGQHTALVTVRDYAGNSTNQTYTYTIINHTPIADAQSVTTGEDTPLQVLLTGSDPDNDPITFTIISTATYGLLGGLAPNLIYTPTANYNGSDAFTFTANDGLENSALAVVTISVTPVNDAPIADAQLLWATAGHPLEIMLSGSDVDGDPLAYTLVTSPTHGALSGALPNLTYTPAPGYAGADTFSFFVSDGELDSAPAAISLNVHSRLYLPVIFR